MTSDPGWAWMLALPRASGFTSQHIRNLEHYYRNPASGGKTAWSSGPHLFIDDDQCWGMCSFTAQGVHARSFNARAIGIEVLGNYDEESPYTGRGRDCWTIAIGVSRVLLDWLGLQANATTVLFHRDDPRTNKTCPGSKVEKTWVLEQITVNDLPMPARMRAI